MTDNRIRKDGFFCVGDSMSSASFQALSARKAQSATATTTTATAKPVTPPPPKSATAPKSKG